MVSIRDFSSLDVIEIWVWNKVRLVGKSELFHSSLPPVGAGSAIERHNRSEFLLGDVGAALKHPVSNTIVLDKLAESCNLIP